MQRFILRFSEVIWVQDVTQVCIEGISVPSQIDINGFARRTAVDVKRFLSILNAFEADHPNMTENTLNIFLLITMRICDFHLQT